MREAQRVLRSHYGVLPFQTQGYKRWLPGQHALGSPDAQQVLHRVGVEDGVEAQLVGGHHLLKGRRRLGRPPEAPLVQGSLLGCRHHDLAAPGSHLQRQPPSRAHTTQRLVSELVPLTLLILVERKLHHASPSLLEAHDPAHSARVSIASIN